MKKLFATLLSAILCISAFAAVASPNTDTNNGNWWQARRPAYKEGFISGYQIGAAHIAGHPTEVNKFSGIELVDGLNDFYKDFRNKPILVGNAIAYVEDELRGLPDDKLAAELQHLRQAASSSDGAE